MTSTDFIGFSNKGWKQILHAAFFILFFTSPLLATEGKPDPVTFSTTTLKIGTKIIHVEVAVTDQQKMRGLMYRKTLPDNGGMLFMLGHEDHANFWMKNTFVPLSIAFIDKEGKILEIVDMQPHDETDIKSKSDRVTYALEMNQRWFDLNGIKVGDIITPLRTTWQQLSIAPTNP